MSLERVEIEVVPARIPYHLRILLDETAEDLSEWQGVRERNEFVPADYVLVFDALCALRPRMPRNPLFIEWGSGLGVVSLMAAALGWKATGVEIQRPLYLQSRRLAERFDLPAMFLHGSFFPEDPTAIEKSDERYAAADLVYVYPWPDQELEIFDLFDRTSKAGALLLTYYGVEDLRVFRKV